MSTEATYAELVSAIKRAHTLGTVGELLGWDEQVNLPPGAADQRANQQAALAESQHAAASRASMGTALTALEATSGGLSDDQRTVVKQGRRDYDRATKLPPEFVREKAAQGSRGYHAWAKARAGNDFASYAPVLAKNLEYAKREAGYLGWGGREYDYMIDRNDPGMTAADIGRLFGDLKQGLLPLVREIAASKVKPRDMKTASVDQTPAAFLFLRR
jgi:carboxypeptidase Taq